jgi:hypothetical protein
MKVGTSPLALHPPSDSVLQQVPLPSSRGVSRLLEQCFAGRPRHYSFMKLGLNKSCTTPRSRGSEFSLEAHKHSEWMEELLNGGVTFRFMFHERLTPLPCVSSGKVSLITCRILMKEIIIYAIWICDLLTTGFGGNTRTCVISCLSISRYETRSSLLT